MTAKFLGLLLLLLLPIPITQAYALPPPSPLSTRSEEQGGYSAQTVLLHIAPNSASCIDATFPSECATSKQAAPFLVEAMERYDIKSAYEMAAVLSLIAFETGDFKYNRNHFPLPGRPGQGTRAMFMPPFVLEYARSIPAIQASLNAITTSDSVNGLTNEQLNAVLELVLPDEYSWASAVWFLVQKCGAVGGVRELVQSGTKEGFERYMGCVGTAATGERLEKWARAKEAFGIV